MKKISYFILSVLIFGTVVGQSALTVPKASAATFDPNNLIDDTTFTNINAIYTSGIQAFLVAQGSFLKNYSEGGRSAAQIIFDAAHGFGDSTGTINSIAINSTTGTVSPYVILATLQKEQGLISMPTQNNASLNAAMGYACPDGGGCNAAYAGFTKQVENGAWQLRYNYERANGRGFTDYQVGQSMSFVDYNGTHSATFSNRSTASLYRYTPHVYNGNYNFWYLYNLYFPSYLHQFVSQNGYPTLAPGDSYNFRVTVKNTGSASWSSGTIHLATNRHQDRVPGFTREGNGPSGWTSDNRVRMQEDSVDPGENATFSFWMRNDGITPGTYREYFRLVADGIQWMEDYGIYWDVRTISTADSYHHSFVSQNAYPSLGKQSEYNFRVTVRNTGTATWRKGVVNLGTSRNLDRVSAFTREGNGPSGWVKDNRITMQEDSVAPGANATFSFWMRNDYAPIGVNREYFRLVADGITWMEDYGIYWDVTAR
ncbi:MAG: hypothetical protein WC773_03205 [Patescibacteria group bacterium]|jgi:hypothetical protein